MLQDQVADNSLIEMIDKNTNSNSKTNKLYVRYRNVYDIIT